MAILKKTSSFFGKKSRMGGPRFSRRGPGDVAGWSMVNQDVERRARTALDDRASTTVS